MPAAAPRPLRRRATLAVIVTAAVLAAYAYGRSAAEPSPRPATSDPPPRRPAPAAPRAAPRETSFGRLLAPERPPAAASPGAAGSQPEPSRVTASGRPTPELVSIVAQQARRKLEEARPELIERCVPESRRGGPGGATFTFNVTFDPGGREIARGISEDRRFRAPEVASCLRRLPLGSLRVPPPGAIVGVRVALNLP
jgi:hypothetical protein